MAAARQLLVGFDGSRPSRVALGRAASVAQHDHACVTVILALDVSPLAAASVFIPGAAPPIQQMERAASWELRRAVEELPADISVTSRIVHGPAGPALAREAQRLSPDAIIIGSHSGIRSRLTGGAARYLRRHAAVPVAVVRTHRRGRRDRGTAIARSRATPPAVAS